MDFKSDEKLTRVAIVNKDKCKPKKCALECKKGCPVNRSRMCRIIISDTHIANNTRKNVY